MAAAVSHVTGFREEEIVGYVLVGNECRPFLSPCTFVGGSRTVRLQTGVELTRPFYSIELRVSDLSSRDWDFVLKTGAMTLRKRESPVSLTERESKLKATLNGGAPARHGARRAWGIIARSCGYPNAQAARVAYGRLRHKLGISNKATLRGDPV
jgi:hypothetical protein